KAANFLMDETQYLPPDDGATDSLAWYNRTASPVLCLSGCTTTGSSAAAAVVLSADPSVVSNYPVAAKRTAFTTAASGSLTIGASTITYIAVARLLSMQRFESYGRRIQTPQTSAITR